MSQKTAAENAGLAHNFKVVKLKFIFYGLKNNLPFAFSINIEMSQLNFSALKDTGCGR